MTTAFIQFTAAANAETTMNITQLSHQPCHCMLSSRGSAVIETAYPDVNAPVMNAHRFILHILVQRFYFRGNQQSASAQPQQTEKQDFTEQNASSSTRRLFAQKSHGTICAIERPTPKAQPPTTANKPVGAAATSSLFSKQRRPGQQFRSPSHLSGLNRTASLSGADRTESLSVSGSNSQLNNSIPLQQYTPDFYVRALSDLQFVKITRAQYQNGLMASRLDSTPQSPESGHNTARLDQTTPPATANTTITDLGADSTPTENGPDETTLLLLNEQNSPHTANHHSQLENSI
ncbi:metal transporter CNNM4 isoform X1 [Lates japonicus]|uniref:Metal transporter CNNM4 isoform X1 n=1 Tax=Lates japonicus TaxID=270547 RepID=A0AAD3MCT5_LATJO|nr:metal transporter CNNM4 isoform X1 [Lates japonicus]